MAKNYASLDLKFILLDCYKKLGLTENELVILLMINHLLENGNKLVTINLLAMKTNINETEIDNIMVSLMGKNMFSYVEDKNGKLKTSLEPLYKILYKEFEKTVLGETISKDEQSQEQIKKLYKEFEETFGRSLAPAELNKIDEWYCVTRYTFNEIEMALKDAKINKSLNFRFIEKNLMKAKKEQDIKQEGFTLRGNNQFGNLSTEEIMDILNEKWTNSEN